MNSDNFLIEEYDIEQAQNICNPISNSFLRQRAMANALAGIIANKYFVSQYEVDTKTGIFNVPQVLSDIEITDIYINNNYIDVRLYFNENELCVPKSHFDNNIQPVAYMFIKLDKTLSGALVAGFIPSENIDTSVEHDEYYAVQESELVSLYDIESLLFDAYDTDIPDNLNVLIYDYLEGNIKNPSEFYKLMLTSKEAREKLIKSAKSETIFKYIAKVSQTSENISDEITASEDTALLDIPVEDNIIESIAFNDNITDLDVPNGDVIELLEYNGEFESLDEDVVATELQHFDEPAEISEGLNNIEEIEDNSFEETFDYDEKQLDVDDDFSTVTTPSLNTIEDELLENSMTSEEVNEDFTYTEDDVLDFSDEDSEITILDEAQNSMVVSEYEEVPYTDEEDQDIEAIELTDESESIELSDDLQTNYIETSIDQTELQPKEATLLEAEDITKDPTDSEVNNEGINKDLDTLFNADMNTENDEEEPQIENPNTEYSEQVEYIAPTQRKRSFVPLLGIFAILAAAGYYGYNYYIGQNTSYKDAQTVINPPVKTEQPMNNTNTSKSSNEKTVQEDAMPNETIENTPTQNINTEDAVSVSIPAIEKNLDASILVSNLKISWEVPASYASNSVAKKYLTKLGKIIQLNLKSELLLLSKPPITNKIALELEVNKNTGKLKLKKMTASSGENSVDTVIKQTVTKILDMNININTSSLTTLQGNPILVIKF